jgi:hypothetical protein
MTDPRLRLDKGAEAENTATLDLALGAETVPPPDIVSFNELRSCADLFRLFDTGKLEIQPDFQREVVWKPDEQTRFIDSLVKQLPIPSMCFSLDYKTQKWKVIDGLQRMSSIIAFLGRTPWRMKDLEDIHPSLRGRRNLDIQNGSEDDQRLYSTVLDVSIPITVLRCDYSQKSHMQYLFTIFHRLNSGGVRLNNQEIRNCIYTGSFNSALKDFDRSDVNWSGIKKRVWGSSDRFRSVELLLRAIAFSETFESYDGNLARFLNAFMHSKMDISSNEAEALTTKLAQMSEAALAAFGNEKTKISMTFIEAALVGILRNLDLASNTESSNLRNGFLRLMDEPLFESAAKYAISSEQNVKTRMIAASKIFSGI